MVTGHHDDRRLTVAHALEVLFQSSIAARISIAMSADFGSVIASRNECRIAPVAVATVSCPAEAIREETPMTSVADSARETPPVQTGRRRPRRQAARISSRLGLRHCDGPQCRAMAVPPCKRHGSNLSNYTTLRAHTPVTSIVTRNGVD
jgi:hypothetical protein